jgi:hypothetical protein
MLTRRHSVSDAGYNQKRDADSIADAQGRRHAHNESDSSEAT